MTFPSPFEVSSNSSAKDSYVEHNKHYVVNAVDLVRSQHEQNTINKVQYNTDNPVGHILDKHTSIKYLLDVGSGEGWCAALASETREKVFAVEPSSAAVATAKALYGHKKNIEWHNGFAEEILPRLIIPDPCIVNLSCVLSHIDDESVIKICKEIDKVTKPGSVLSASELWGLESHEHLWHCRTQAWWQNRFPGWELTFKDLPCQVPGRFKSFSGIKK